MLYLAANHENVKGKRNGVYLAPLDGALNKLVVRSSAQAQCAAGNLLYYANGGLLAQPFNMSIGSFEHDPVTIAEGIQMDARTRSGLARPSRQHGRRTRPARRLRRFGNQP
jgi:hypothetical protein